MDVSFLIVKLAIYQARNTVLGKECTGVCVISVNPLNEESDFITSVGIQMSLFSILYFK